MKAAFGLPPNRLENLLRRQAELPLSHRRDRLPARLFIVRPRGEERLFLNLWSLLLRDESLRFARPLATRRLLLRLTDDLVRRPPFWLRARRLWELA